MPGNPPLREEEGLSDPEIDLPGDDDLNCDQPSAQALTDPEEEERNARALLPGVMIPAHLEGRVEGGGAQTGEDELNQDEDMEMVPEFEGVDETVYRGDA